MGLVSSPPRRAFGAFFSALALATPALAGDWSMPHDASTEGWRTDWLINITLVFITILFAIMVSWMLLACWRFGPKKLAAHDYGDSKGAIFFTLATALAIFACVDGNLFVNSTLDLQNVFWDFPAVEKNPQVLRIEINAHQWAWDARYAGPDGKFNTADDAIVLGDVRVPIDTPVLIEMGAVDVIHCLYIPNLRIKQDIIPGTITRTWFQAKEAGTFEIACAQHCGVNHYKMRGTLTVLPRAEWQEWLEQTSTNSLRAYDSDDVDSHWGWEWREA
jgi:cytochrome c oxidase subunit II